MSEDEEKDVMAASAAATLDEEGGGDKDVTREGGEITTPPTTQVGKDERKKEDQESIGSNDVGVTCISKHIQKLLPCGHLGCNFHTSSSCRMCDMDAAAAAAVQKEHVTTLALVSTENGDEHLENEELEVIDMLNDSSDDESIEVEVVVEVLSGDDDDHEGGGESDATDIYQPRQPIVIDMLNDSSDDEEEGQVLGGEKDILHPRTNEMDSAQDVPLTKRSRLNDEATSPPIIRHDIRDHGLATGQEVTSSSSTSIIEHQTGNTKTSSSILKDLYLVEEVMTQAKSVSLQQHLSKWYTEHSKHLKRPPISASTSEI